MEPKHQRPPQVDLHLWEIRWLRELLAVFLLGLSIWIVYSLRGVLIPVFLALVLAHIFNPLVRLPEQRWHWPRPLTISLLLALLLALLAGFIAWLAPVAIRQGAEFLNSAPDYISKLAGYLGLDIKGLSAQLSQSIQELEGNPKQILAELMKATHRAINVAALFANLAAYWSISSAMVFVYFFFFSWHYDRALGKLKLYIPVSHREKTLDLLGRMDGAIGRFFRGRLLIAIAVGALLSGGWFFANVPYWLVLGMLTGLLNIIPFLAFIGWPLAILLKYAGGSGAESSGLIAVVVWPSVVYLTVQFLDGWVLTPWVQSGETDLSAATVLLVVIIGGAAAGLLGMLFAIPIAACLKILFEDLILPRTHRWVATH